MRKKIKIEEIENLALDDTTTKKDNDKSDKHKINKINYNGIGNDVESKSKVVNLYSIPKPLKILLGIVFVLLVIFIILCSVFKLKKVEIEGNTLYDNEKIKKVVLNDSNSWNTLYVFIKYRMTNTKDTPFIDKMNIKMVNPTTLKINVCEKEMLGYIYIPAIDSNAYFDKDTPLLIYHILYYIYHKFHIYSSQIYLYIYHNKIELFSLSCFLHILFLYNYSLLTY